VPVATPTRRFAFDELARRHGDYAVVGLAAGAQFNGDTFDRVRLAWLGVGPMPMRSVATEQLLQGQRLTDALLAQALQTLREELPAEADLTHSAAAKQHLAGVMLKRSLQVLAAPAPATA
jgi:carbon-monoxide dehydrogenase medium subunit